MSYQVFARKYRPLTFNDVIGQDHVIQTLRHAIEQNRLAHAYLFVGPRGTGKTSTARIFAKALNCTGGPKVDFDPNEDICREIAEGRSLDVLEIDGASNRGIDNIRDLRDNVRFAPSSGTFRIVYIDEVHMLTKESFNALLKTLEEPPPHVKFIFATTEPHKILPTILSRCQRFDLRPIPTETIATHLLHIAKLEGVALSDEAAFAVAKAADGGMRDAQSMLDQLVSFCGTTIDETQVLDIFGITSRETVSTVLTHILSKDLPSLLHLIHEQAEAGRDMGQLLSEIISSVREILVAKVDPTATLESIPHEHLVRMGDLLNKTRTDKILRLVEVLSETEDKMRWSSNKRLHLEMGLIKAVHALAEASISDIIKAIEGAPLTTGSPEIQYTPPTQVIIASTPSIPVATTAPVTPPPANPPAPDTFGAEDAIPSFTTTPISSLSTPPSPLVVEGVPALAKEKQEIDEKESTIKATETEVEVKAPDTTLFASIPGTSSEPEQASPPPALPQVDTTPIPSASPTSRPLMAISSDPVRLEPIPTILDEQGDETQQPPEEPTPVDTLTTSFTDTLFSPPVEIATVITDEPTEHIEATSWQQIIDSIAKRFPIKAEFIRHSQFMRQEGINYIVAVHSSDTQARDTLIHPQFKTKVEEILSANLGFAVTLVVKISDHIPPPPEEELEPLPEPKKKPIHPFVSSKKESSQQPTPAEAPISPTAPKKDGPNFYEDPFILQALEAFKARIIK
ncbi:MAG: DNA polymerase III subunit gamma/tau [Akkermansia sp.]